MERLSRKVVDIFSAIITDQQRLALVFFEAPDKKAAIKDQLGWSPLSKIFAFDAVGFSGFK